MLLLPAGVVWSQIKGVQPAAEPASRAASGTTYAVVVGISDYQNPTITDLKYADRDAEAFAWFLQSPAGGNVQREHMRVLLNAEATLGNFAAALDWLVEQCAEGDKAVIYFSGHGDVEAKTFTQPGFLLCWDAPASVYMGGGAFGLMYMDLIISTLSIEKKAQVLVVADACRAGKLAGSGIGGAQITASNLAQQKAQETKILSCQPNEFSLEGMEWGDGRGVFSFHLINGLQGLADRGADGSVTLMEIERYLEDLVPSSAAPHNQLPLVVGAKSSVISRVDAGQLATLREALARNQNTGLAMIDSRNVDDILADGSDPGTVAEYRKFKDALKAGHLLYPEEGAAYTLFQEIENRPSLLPFKGLMRRNLAAAFQNEAQQAINDYLSANPAELHKRWNFDKRYQYFPEYLSKAAEILGAEHYLYKGLKAREHYFTGLQLRLAGEKEKNKEYFKTAVLKQQEALQLDSNAAYAYNELGLLERRLGNFRSSVHYFEQAIARSPNWVLPWFNLCSVYFDDIKDYEAAEHCGQQAVRIAPGFGPAFYNLACVYYQLEQWGEAKAFFERALQVDPDYHVAYFNLGLIHYHEKDFAAAENAWNAYRQRVPRDPDVYQNLGELALETGQPEAALKYFRKVLDLDPEYQNAHSSVCKYYLDRSQYKEAEESVWKYHQIYPQAPEPFFLLACLYAGMGKNETALTHLSNALQKGFDDRERLANAPCMSALQQNPSYIALLERYFPGN